MVEVAIPNTDRNIELIYRTESRRVFATLIRLLGSFDLAEEALHDAFAAAAEKWPQEGVPANPYAWLVSTGRFKAIATLRCRTRFDASPRKMLARAGVTVVTKFIRKNFRSPVDFPIRQTTTP